MHKNDILGSESGFKLNIDKSLLDYLGTRNYTLNDLFVVYCIYHEDRKDLLSCFLINKNLDQVSAFFQRYLRKMLIQEKENLETFNIHNYEVTELGEELLTETVFYFNTLEVLENTIQTPLDEIVVKYRELWPLKVKNKAGDVIRSNEVDCKNKLKTFFKKYKYSEDIILKATLNYLTKQASQGYEYCNGAQYFIMKNGISKLANECEAIINSEDTDLEANDFTNQLM